MKKLVLFGKGEIATLARYYFDQDSNYEVVAFTADDDQVDSDSFSGLPLVPFSHVTEAYPPDAFEMHIALSYRGHNQIRARKYNEAVARGYALASYVCSKSVYWEDLQIGSNCFILENQTIQPTVRIGDNVVLWSGNHIGHGCQIDDHVYVASHVVLSGHTKIGAYTFLGVNATLRDFISVGESCFVTMDASVTRDIPAGAVVFGAQCEVIEPDTEKAERIKRRYFFAD
jgi:sugar O-acyltransferase (sialic acid O-acetyltransferase NeuD family)